VREWAVRTHHVDTSCQQTPTPNSLNAPGWCSLLEVKFVGVGGALKVRLGDRVGSVNQNKVHRGA
jgi:hypothetical protein